MDRIGSPVPSDTSASSSSSTSYQNILNNNSTAEEEILHRKHGRRRVDSDLLPSPASQVEETVRRKSRGGGGGGGGIDSAIQDDQILLKRKRRSADSQSPVDQLSPDSKRRRVETDSPKSSLLFFESRAHPAAKTGGGGGHSTGVSQKADFNRKSGASSLSKQVPQNGRSPKCAQCQNHGELVRVKGHKRYCPWRSCKCYKCNVTYDRRRVMASQVAVRRAQQQDEARAREYSIPVHPQDEARLRGIAEQVQAQEEARAVGIMSTNSTSQGPDFEPPDLYYPFSLGGGEGLRRRRGGGSVTPSSLSALPPSLPPPSSSLASVISSSRATYHPPSNHHHHRSRVVSGDQDQLPQPHTHHIHPISSSPTSLLDREKASHDPHSSDNEGDAPDNKSTEGGSVRSQSRSTTDRDSVRGRSPKSVDGSGGRSTKHSSHHHHVHHTTFPPHSSLPPVPSSILAGKMFGSSSSRGGGGGGIHNSSAPAFIKSSWPGIVDPLLTKAGVHGGNGTSVAGLVALPSPASAAGGGGGGGPVVGSPSSMAAVAAAAATACGVDPAAAHFGALKMYPHFGLQGAETMTAIDEMKESVKALMEMFRLPSETDFLIYRILKDYRGDFKQASSKIFEAQCELRSWELLREAARGVYPYYNPATAYYYPSVTGSSSAVAAAAAAAAVANSHPSNPPPDLYNSISTTANHRINIAALGKAQVTPTALPALEDRPSS